jgi:hypothetical protein
MEQSKELIRKWAIETAVSRSKYDGYSDTGHIIDEAARFESFVFSGQETGGGCSCATPEKKSVIDTKGLTEEWQKGLIETKHYRYTGGFKLGNGHCGYGVIASEDTRGENGKIHYAGPGLTFTYLNDVISFTPYKKAK